MYIGSRRAKHTRVSPREGRNARRVLHKSRPRRRNSLLKLCRPDRGLSSRGFSKFPKKPRYHLDIELVVVHSFLHYFLRQFFQVKPRSRFQVFAASIIGPETTGCPRVENVLSSLRIRPPPRQELRRILFFFRIISSSMRDETNRTEQRDASKLLYCFRWQIVDNREINLENQVFR